MGCDRYGSSFETLADAQASGLQFDADQLQKVLAIVCRLLDSKRLEHLDAMAAEVLALPASPAARFPYRHFGETLNLVLITLLKVMPE